MGQLLIFTAAKQAMFEAIVDCFFIGSRPNKEQRRRANSVEEKILDNSEGIPNDIRIVCPSCKTRHPVPAWDKYQWWRNQEGRTLKQETVDGVLRPVPAVIFLEDAEFNYLCTVIDGLESVPQPLNKHLIEWEDLVEESKKTWAGSEADLMKRYKAIMNGNLKIATTVVEEEVKKE